MVDILARQSLSRLGRSGTKRSVKKLHNGHETEDIRMKRVVLTLHGVGGMGNNISSPVGQSIGLESCSG